MDKKNPHAVALGHLSAQSRTPEELSESNRRAARARWGESAEEKYMAEALAQIAAGELKVDPVGGRILRVVSRSGKPCEPVPIGFKMTTGYKAISIRLPGSRKAQAVLIHRLVWSALFGSIPAGMTINHKNGRKGDNWPENLEVVTQAENNRHAREVLGVSSPPPTNRGEAQHLAKLTEKAVAEIRARYVLGGISQRALAKEYGVHQAAIFHVLRGSTWNGGKNVGHVFNENGKHAPKVGPIEVREIRRRHAAGEDFGALAAEFGCSRNNAYYIVTRRTWKNVD